MSTTANLTTSPKKMTILELLVLAAFTFGALLLAAATPQSYRPMVYSALLVVWGFVLLYLMLPPGSFYRQIPHWIN